MSEAEARRFVIAKIEAVSNIQAIGTTCYVVAEPVDLDEWTLTLGSKPCPSGSPESTKSRSCERLTQGTNRMPCANHVT
jgi:hypothetical protein